MFVRYFLEMPVDQAQVWAVLTNDTPHWLARLAEASIGRADALLAEAGIAEEPRRPRRLTVELGQPLSMAHKQVLPMRWAPKGASGSFPPIDADLEVASLAPERTQLSISARFASPAGVPNRAAFSRVAEATVKDFLDAVGEAIMALPISA